MTSFWVAWKGGTAHRCWGGGMGVKQRKVKVNEDTFGEGRLLVKVQVT